jgi:hypothetical protein
MLRTSTFESRVRELCQQLIDCKTEDEVVELSRQLRELIHERVEQIRNHVILLSHAAH